jgi:hypothetical protein
MDKKKAERIHSQRRALERNNLNLTSDVRNILRGQIKKNKGKFLYRESRRVTVWEVAHQEQKYKVVYDKLRKEIVTFLPLEESIGELTN